MNQLFNLLLPWPAREFNPITDPFVYVIFFFFVICLGIFLWKTIRRAGLIDGLIKTVSEYSRPAKPDILPRLKEEFDSNKELKEVWQEFEDSLIPRQRDENQEKIVYKTDESSIFLSEERLLGRDINLRFWNSVPSILVGLGILGTFVGLVWGLIPFSGIDFTQTEQIQGAIKKLLSGVSTAFVTSVWGMLTSLVFNFVEKLGIEGVSKAIADLQHALDRLFTLTTQEEIAFRQEDELEQQTAALKSFSTDLANDIKRAMGSIIAEARVQDEKGNREIIQELHKVPDAISHAMEPNLNRLNMIIKNLKAVVTESAEGIKNEIKLERQEIAQGLRNAPDAISHAMAERLIPNIGNLKAVVEELRKQSEKLDALHQNLMKSRIQNTQNNQEIVQELQKVPNAISHAMEPNLSSLNMAVENLNVAVIESKNDIQNEMKQGRQEILGELHDAHSALSNAMAEKLIPGLDHLNAIVRDIHSETEQSKQEVVQELYKLSVSLAPIETLAEMAGGMSKNLINLPQHVAQIANDIQELLKSIVNQTNEQFNQRLADMDEFLQRSAQTLQDVQQSAGTLLQLQNEQIEAINNQLTHSRATLATGRDMLQEMNASITSTHQITQTMQVVAGKLIEGAKRIETAGQQLNRASVMFNEGHQNSLEVIRETAHQIQRTLAQSQPLLNNFTQGFQRLFSRLDQSFNDIEQAFQTIEDGLNGIFAEIENGLNTYADTTRESINEYLKDFSEQFAQAATALSRSVQTLRDSVDGLTEMNENQLTSAAKVLTDSVETLRESTLELNDIKQAANRHGGK